jgi:hypothetical protein
MELPTESWTGDANWHFVRINDPKLTYGRTLGVFIDGIITFGVSEISSVVIASVEGGGDPQRGITPLGCVRLSKVEFLKRLTSTEQLDWADFYFFKDVTDETVRSICGGSSIVDAIAASVFAVRVIDDSSLDLFTTSIGLSLWLTDRYPDAETQFGPLATMPFPG